MFLFLYLKQQLQIGLQLVYKSSTDGMPRFARNFSYDVAYISYNSDWSINFSK